MLAYAHVHADRLRSQYARVITDPRYRFYHQSGWVEFAPRLADDTWRHVEMVSLDRHGDVIGYLRADVDRVNMVVDNLQIANLTPNVHPVFARDLYRFAESLFKEQGFRKMHWHVTAGNPAEKLYRKVVERYGGREVGRFLEEVRMPDGSYADIIHFELFNPFAL